LVDEKNNLAAVANALTEKIEKNKRVLDMRIDNLFQMEAKMKNCQQSVSKLDEGVHKFKEEISK
jgi:hypothetical protein